MRSMQCRQAWTLLSLQKMPKVHILDGPPLPLGWKLHRTIQFQSLSSSINQYTHPFHNCAWNHHLQLFRPVWLSTIPNLLSHWLHSCCIFHLWVSKVDSRFLALRQKQPNFDLKFQKSAWPHRKNTINLVKIHGKEQNILVPSNFSIIWKLQLTLKSNLPQRWISKVVRWPRRLHLRSSRLIRPIASKGRVINKPV